MKNTTATAFAELTLLGLLLLGSTSPAQAVLVDGTPDTTPSQGLEISITPGAAIPTDIEANSINRSALLQGSIVKAINPTVSLGLEMGYAFGSEKTYSFEDISGSDKTSILHVTPVIEIGKWLPTRFGTWKPYVVFGGGFYNVQDTFSFSKGGFSLHDTSSGGFGGFNYGAGLLLQLGNRLALGPDVRYHEIFISEAPDFHYLTTGLRLAFLF